MYYEIVVVQANIGFSFFFCLYVTLVVLEIKHVNQ